VRSTLGVRCLYHCFEVLLACPVLLGLRLVEHLRAVQFVRMGANVYLPLAVIVFLSLALLFVLPVHAARPMFV
jgi:hypothetical protein